jgi:hypothetical protein
MDEGPLTFRDHFLSVYQSYVAEVARRKAEQAGVLEGTTPEGVASKPVEVAAAEAAAHEVAERAKAAGRLTVPAAEETLEGTTLEDMSLGENAEVCAKLAMRLLWAKLSGNEAEADEIEDEHLPASKCDILWAKTITDYLNYFGPGGEQRKIPYVRPSDVGPKVITIKAGARIGLVGDWATGALPARRVLQQLKAQKPDVLVHLGDIYYSGTDTECRENFEAIVNAELDRKTTNIPVYTLSGNHDMYSGGVGYYAMLRRLNKTPMTQPASFFCLRSEDNAWQLLAMDTGQHDHSPISVTDALTYVEPDELAWHEARIAEFSGKTILLSHHQLFSAFSQIGQADANGQFLPYNPQLKKAFDRFRATGKPIAAWFWGHEHNLCIYKSYLGLTRGRCLGHSAVPVFQKDDPYDVVPKLNDPPQIVDAAKLSVIDGLYAHGFAMLNLGAQQATADYFEDRNGTATKTYSETID